MNGGYANIFDTSAMSQVVMALAGADVKTVKTGAQVDRKDYSDSDLLQHLAVIAIVDCAIGGVPTAGDSIDVTVEWEDSATDGSGYADHKTVTTNVVTDDNATAQIAVVLPVKLLQSERYGVGKVLAAMGGGSIGTLTTATGALIYNVFPMNGQPASVYDTDLGYADSILA